MDDEDERPGDEQTEFNRILELGSIATKLDSDAVAGSGESPMRPNLRVLIFAPPDDGVQPGLSPLVENVSELENPRGVGDWKSPGVSFLLIRNAFGILTSML